MTRTFLAIELSEESREALQREIARLRTALPSVCFVDPVSLHLTLAFLGELDDVLVAQAMAAASETAAESTPFMLTIAGMGTFGSPATPRVIWAGVSGEVAALFAVQSRLARALAAHGFTPEDRSFTPHLTLGRLKQPLDEDSVQRLAEVMRESSGAVLASLRVEALAVMKSELTPQGAHYTRIRAYALALASGGQ